MLLATGTSPFETRWNFDSICSGVIDTYNGVLKNDTSFVSPGYNGYGSALSLDALRSQYVLVPRFLNMTYRSFTWEMWAYPTSLLGKQEIVGMKE